MKLRIQLCQPGFRQLYMPGVGIGVPLRGIQISLQFTRLIHGVAQLRVVRRKRPVDVCVIRLVAGQRSGLRGYGRETSSAL